MLKKLKNNIQKFISKCTSKEPEEVASPVKKPKAKKDAVERVDLLRQELEAIDRGYSKAEEKLIRDYDAKLVTFENEYRKLQEVQQQYAMKLIKESELDKAKKDIEPYEEALRDAGFELEKVQGYKKDEILKIIADIDALKDSFTDELETRVEAKAMILQDLRNQYLKEIACIGELYRTGLEVETTVQKHLTEYHMKHTLHLKEMLEIKTENVPVLYKHLIIPQEAIDIAMAGKIEYRKA
ncbi:hypothetical protein [Oceanobacillus picturae]|uniref:hypothetical protein n=1 Tax=Oceanobacillus picturae TaxID=171693 RepID=UPI000E696A3F|nr:hypothetical protein [Oceanobacillus picturae]RIU93301.1 hypothetical protein D1864_07460 [Oceanobacillus picturae]